MICYHTTDAAEAILRHGFKGTTGSYMVATLELTGVFLGDSLMNINEGATGDQVLRVELPDDADLGEFGLVEENTPYREMVRTCRVDQCTRQRDIDDRGRD
ncbi:hypothetical protein OG921_04705 [Aldersonia sp. NBC_00410]|uniref:hypothetical protein n=1 Tax=Aldersonia sp. NBC_00410 TaxID=2975954 RepID=UPI00224D3CD8|nr:hypothetical protein [Aldersonia sp. NBC_00410]MCX5042473.1 hypothetical protein [Aldersonia sp. NBC_00410]